MQMSGFQLGHPFHFFYKGNELLYWSCSYQNFVFLTFIYLFFQNIYLFIYFY